jgi:hypothetical protein
MRIEIFEQQDRAMLNAFKSVREKKVPPQVLEGFSAAVEDRIRRKQARHRPHFVFQWPRMRVLVPSLAVLLIALLMTLKMPYDGKDYSPVKSAKTAIRTTPIDMFSGPIFDIVGEVALLRELGVWTEEDEDIFGELSEYALEILDLVPIR